MNVRDEYQAKLVSADEAVGRIEDGAFIVQSNAAGEPPALLAAVADRARAGEFTHVAMTSLLPLAASAATILSPEVSEIIHWESTFASGFDRGLIGSGEAVLRPAFFHQVPRLYEESLDIDVALLCVSPMDKHGYMSFGVSVDTSIAALRKARYVVLEVNSHMPRVHGNAWVHISEADAVVENEAAIFELPTPAARGEDAAIGRAVAERIPDGATIQLGIGGIPNAVAKSLMDHRDLGIHTEMFVDSMVDMIEKGVATGTRKTFHAGKALFAFCAGTRRTYEFLDDNPHLEGHPVSYTNHPSNIAKNDNMISVNATLQVDLTGQCCSEAIGPLQFSGTGGQHDFARGAYDSRGGKSIIALYSTAKNGAVSRVVSTHGAGSVVTTPRNEVQFLVSEFGIVDLKGKTTRDRALAIIELAHPKFREQLAAEARTLGYTR